MFTMQDALLQAHPKWEPHNPACGLRQLLWMIGEIGEVIDIVKKKSAEDLTNPGVARTHLIEELVDVQMYLIDVMDCYGIPPEEIAQGYLSKHQYNMKRDF